MKFYENVTLDCLSLDTKVILDINSVFLGSKNIENKSQY